LENLLPGTVHFLHDSGELPPQVEDSQWLLDLAFLTDFTPEINDLNTEFHGKKTNINQMISNIDFFKEI
jgi:hypothetical protein